MAKFNIVDRRRFNANGPIKTVSATPDTTTHLGAPGYTRDVKSELFLLGGANFVGEVTFHEGADDRDDRFNHLVREVAVLDVQWLTEFLTWLRRAGNMRSAGVVAACQAVHTRLAASLHGGNRQLIAAVPNRADEPGELIAYWRSRYGRTLPQPVKRGIADAVARLYNERSLLKYDSDTAGYRFADVIELCHPKPTGRRKSSAGSFVLGNDGQVQRRPESAWQSALFEHALARRHRRAELFRRDPLPTLLRREELMAIPAGERRAWLEQAVASGRAADRFRSAGVTWEALSGWLGGPMDATAWEAVIPSMGLMALARNLRNFDEAGVSDAVAAQVCARFADPDEVAQSRMFPYRWLAAYETAPSLRWGHALDQALRASLANLPAMPGRSLILVDTSNSMTSMSMSAKSKMTPLKAAAVFGVALAAKGEQVDLWGFADGAFRHDIPRGASVIDQVKRFCARSGEVGHGTQIAAAARATFAGHDRVFVISDMQTMGHTYYGGNLSEAVPRSTPLYGFNLGGYKPAAFDAGTRNRVELGGLTDATFTLIPLIERGVRAGWPWEDAA